VPGPVHSQNPAPRKEQGKVPRDLLREHSEDVASILFLLAVALLIASLLTGVSKNLPSIALGWTFGIAVIRAGVVFAVVAALTVFLVRGWGGLWPQRISTTGIDFQQLAEGSDSLEHAVRTMMSVALDLQTVKRPEANPGAGGVQHG